MPDTKYNSIELGKAAAQMGEIKKIVKGYIDPIPGVTFVRNENNVKVSCNRKGGYVNLNKILVNDIVSGFRYYTKNLDERENDIYFDFIDLEEYIILMKTF